MAFRKYASDYRLETYVTPGGGQQQRRVYQGVYYEFRQGPDVIRRLRRVLFAGAFSILVLLMPLLFINTDLGRTIYVVLPVAAAFVPLYLLLAAAHRLGFPETPFTREHRDKTDRRLRVSLVVMPVFLGIGCAGCVVYCFLCEWRAAELLCSVCLAGAWAVSLGLLTQRKKAQTVPAEKS